MKYVLIFLVLASCTHNNSLNERNIDSIYFSTNLSIEDFKKKLNEYVNMSDYPNIDE
tara:strand:- start:1960 stop:2130 length:171 start_codon:yes stop_codon:yes gene_type:complete